MNNTKHFGTRRYLRLHHCKPHIDVGQNIMFSRYRFQDIEHNLDSTKAAVAKTEKLVNKVYSFLIFFAISFFSYLALATPDNLINKIFFDILALVG